MNGAYYNENDDFAAAWLRELIAGGHIAAGEVDTRSICDVAPADLRGFTQVHLFAGIGGWSYALRLAGWPDDRPVWTASFPCQPYSAAGKQLGAADERNLWPVGIKLIAACKPERIFGEQVEAAVRLGWLDGVFGDLEGEGYACGAAVLGAHSVGAPHIRQRIYWMADAECDTGNARRLTDESGEGTGTSSARPHVELGRCSVSSGMGDTNGGITGHRGLQPGGEHGQRTQDGGVGERLGNASRLSQRSRPEVGRGTVRHEGPPVAAASHWRGKAVLIPCADSKQRIVEPSIFPLAYGVPNRVGTLRGAGNAIVPQVAAEFIAAAVAPGT